MARTGVYNQLAVAVVIDGISSTDLGDEFAYRIEKPDSQASSNVGTQRSVTNFSSNKTATLFISVLPESVVNDQIAQLEYNQVRGRGREFNITIYTAEGEVVTCNRCSIRQGAGLEGGGPEGVARQTTFNVNEFIADKSNFT